MPAVISRARRETEVELAEIIKSTAVAVVVVAKHVELEQPVPRRVQSEGYEGFGALDRGGGYLRVLRVLQHRP